LRRVCDFLDLPWNRSMLDYHKTAEERMSEIHPDRREMREEEFRAIFSLTSKPPQRDE
jgi:hypothetical protein